MRGQTTLLTSVLLLGALALAGGLLSGCGIPTAALPDTLKVERGFVPPYQAVPQFHPAPFQQVVSGQTSIQPLYDVTRALPTFPTNVPMNCGMEYGFHYHLTFLQDRQQVLLADADPSGCPVVTLNGHDPRTPTDAFWQDLATTLGRPLPDVLPRPTFTVPTASPSVP
jgi:hypothetical protein